MNNNINDTTNNNTNINQHHNYSSDEIEKFSHLAHQWWDTENQFAPLHAINPLRLDWINEIGPVKNQSVLDIGCGGGILSESLAKKGASVIGIDLSVKSLKVAKLHLLEQLEAYPDLKLEYRKSSSEEYAQKNPQSHDIVTCLEMLEHVPDVQSVIDSIATIVKSDGFVFLSTLNRNLTSYLKAVIGAEYLLNLLPQGTHDYRKFITPSELTRMARNAGLIPVAVTGLTYNPLTKKYRLCDDISVNYMMAFKKV